MTLSTSVTSNAFNFLNFINSQVDPRTGQYTCALGLPELKANQLAGPAVPLHLNFNPLNTADSGFGKGWNLQLTQFNLANGILSLYTGETFRVIVQGTEIIIPEKKIDSFHFHVEDINRYRVEHKSGLVEILQVGQGQLAMPVQMFSPQGHSVSLKYEPFGTEPLLSSINNEDGSCLLSLVRTANVMKVMLFPGTALETLFVLNIMGGETTSIVLPTEDSASWRFSYIVLNDLTCLKHVYTPSAGHETVTYSGKPHYFPGLSDRRLPRVATHTRDPGFGQPAIETRYTYGSKDPDNTNDHNFLGYGSDIVWSEDGLDNLYKVRSNYEYETQEHLWDFYRNRAVRTTRRVYNRFHLMLSEEVRQMALLASDDTLFLTDIDYHIDPLADFKDQPNYCQLPKTVTQTWRKSAFTLPRHTEVVSTTYDDFGNVLTQTNANGVTETYTWYDNKGEEGCPADPQDFVRNLKSKTVTPACSVYGQAPTLQHRYRYAAHQGLNDRVSWLAMSEETLTNVIMGDTSPVLRTITHAYLEELDDPLRFGLIQKITLTVNDQTSSSTTTIYDYDFTHSPHANVMARRTVSTLIGHDDTPDRQVRKVITEEHSLLDGIKLSSKDANGAEILYHHDRLGRVTEEVAAPGTDYVANRRYQYTLSNGGLGQQAAHCTTDIKGVTTRTWFDGLDRLIREERQDIDALGGDPSLFRTTYTATYNYLGQLTHETHVDWEGDKNIALTTTFEYDAWGEQHKVTGADGVVRITENDPASQTSTTWTQNTGMPVKISGKRRTTLNLFGKEDRVEALDSKGLLVNERLYFYDGLGNCVEQLDEMGEPTRFKYDPFFRIQSITLPDFTEIHRQYAAHTGSELPVRINVVYGETTSCVGKQTFDGLDRRTALKVGPRLQQFMYEGGHSQASRMITAGQKSISYTYIPELAQTPASSTAPDDTSRFNYDPQSAQLTSSKNLQSELTFEYNFSGQLITELWKDKASGKQSGTAFTHTLSGRPLTRIDTNGMTCTYTYDPLARIKGITQGHVIARFDYDELGQVILIDVQDQNTQQTVETRLTFDDQGRETVRHISLGDGHPAQIITQSYRGDNRLTYRHLHVGDKTELLETFGYDQRGRMVEYICDGERQPKDRYGNAIHKQLFSFDALDNITAVYTTFADGSFDDALNTFALDDPCQLIRITHSHPDYLLESDLELLYDENGNLVQDETGQTLHYDSQSRLVKVTGSDGTDVSQYRYDAHNFLQGVKHGTEKETLRFYQDDLLCRTVQGDTQAHYLYFDEQPLSQQQQDDPTQTLLLMTDGKNSVLAETGQRELRKATYGAYGARNLDDDLKCALGFNGEVRDQQSGWYLLGQGYRAYNPTLMRFHSPDSLSPFGAGGVNPYTYCAGDPINFVDPTGHANRGVNWMGVLGAAMSAVGIALTVAAVVIAPPVGAAAIASTTAFTGIGIGGGAYGIYEGVMATTATRIKDREKHETSALISGGLDVAFGAWGLWGAIRVAKNAASAKVNWHKMVQESLGKVDGAYAARNASRNVSAVTIDTPSGISRNGSVRSTRGENTVNEVSPNAYKSVAGASGTTRQAASSPAPVEPKPDYGPPTPPTKPKKHTGGSVNPDGSWATTTEVRDSRLNNISVEQPPEHTVASLRKKIGSRLNFR